MCASIQYLLFSFWLASLCMTGSSSIWGGWSYRALFLWKGTTRGNQRREVGRAREGGQGTDLAAAIPFPAVAPPELPSALPQRPFRAGQAQVPIGCLVHFLFHCWKRWDKGPRDLLATWRRGWFMLEKCHLHLWLRCDCHQPIETPKDCHFPAPGTLYCTVLNTNTHEYWEKAFHFIRISLLKSQRDHQDLV